MNLRIEKMDSLRCSPGRPSLAGNEGKQALQVKSNHRYNSIQTSFVE
jgi:hypothetical protein